jgi:hypothetical protein
MRMVPAAHVFGVIAVILAAVGITWNVANITRVECGSIPDVDLLEFRLPRKLEAHSPVATQYLDKTCLWVFQKYVPSPWEDFWVENIQKLQDNVCEEANKERERIDEWVDGGLKNKVADPLVLPTSTFSRFHFLNNCTGEELIDYIEPLAGLTRHPFYCLKVTALFLLGRTVCCLMVICIMCEGDC